MAVMRWRTAEGRVWFRARTRTWLVTALMGLLGGPLTWNRSFRAMPGEHEAHARFAVEVCARSAKRTVARLAAVGRTRAQLTGNVPVPLIGG